MPLAEQSKRAGAIAQLLSSSLRSDSDSDDGDHSPTRAPLKHSFHSSHPLLDSPRRRHHAASGTLPRPPPAALRCAVAGCMQRRCAEGVGGLCVAHAILHLPVQQLSGADKPHTLAAYQRRLRRHPKEQRAHWTEVAEATARQQPIESQSQHRPSSVTLHSASASAAALRSQSHQSYRRYSEGERQKHEEGRDGAASKLPEFAQRLPTVADLKPHGLHAFAVARREAKRSKPNSRNGSRRGTTTRLSADAQPASGGSEQPHAGSAPSAYSSTTQLFHARRTPAGLTLERSHTAAEALRVLRLAVHARPHAAAATTALSGTLTDAVSFRGASAAAEHSIESDSPPTLTLSSASAVPTPPLLLLAPAKHMKALSAVEAQRLYRADLLARLMQRPPVAPLLRARLERMERLFKYRPAYASVCSRQVVRSHSDDEAMAAARREKRRRLELWLSTRCALAELHRRRVVWDALDNVRSRTGRLDEWMAGRLARHRADRHGLRGAHDSRMTRWQVSTYTAEDDAAMEEPQLSIVVLEPSPRNAAVSGKLSAKGSPKHSVPQLALPQTRA